MARAPLAVLRAIAGLLRAADGELRDAALLLRQERTGSAALLAASARDRLALALAISEAGQVAAAGGALPAANPLASRLPALAAPGPPQPDGRLADPPPAAVLKPAIAAIRGVLAEAAAAFEVELEGQDVAGNALPIRPPPAAPPKEPPKESPKEPAKEAPRAPPAPDAPRPQAPSPRARAAAGRPPAPAIARPAGKPAAAPRRAGGIVIPPAPPPAAAPARPPPAPSPAIDLPRPAGAISSAAFWSLMDRWGVDDLAALALIGHAGGLTKKGTRPRFKLEGAEAETMARLREIDAALETLELPPPRWLGEAIREPPFRGATPLALLTGRPGAAAAEVLQYLLRLGLQRSLG